VILNSAGTDVSQQGTAPLSYLLNGDATFNLYEALSSGTTHTYTDIGTFNVDANNGVDTITFTGADVAVPEPATYGIFGGIGVLLLGLRRQLTGKLA
jgi:hypothetical protein